MMATFIAVPFVAAAESTLAVVAQGISNGSIPQGAQRVPVLKLILDVPCSDVSLESVTLIHRGLGRLSDIAGVYAMRDGVRISRVSTPASNNGPVILRLTKQELQPCKADTIDIMMDIASTADIGGQHSFIIRSSSDMEFIGAQASLRSIQAVVARIVPEMQRRVSFEQLSLLARPLYGVNRTVGRFRLEASGNNLVLREITLTNAGSARDGDVTNLALYNARGVLVSPIVPMLDDDSVRFTFTSPFALQQPSQLFTLRGDIRARRRQTINFSVEESSDVLTQTVRSRN